MDSNLPQPIWQISLRTMFVLTIVCGAISAVARWTTGLWLGQAVFAICLIVPIGYAVIRGPLLARRVAWLFSRRRAILAERQHWWSWAESRRAEHRRIEADTHRLAVDHPARVNSLRAGK